MKKDWFKIKWNYIAVFLMSVVWMMGMPVEANAATEGDWDGAKQAVLTAYQNYQTEVDVSSYRLNYASEYNYLKEMMGEVVNETPYIFFAATSYTVFRNSTTNQIVKIGLGYTDAYSKSNGGVRVKKIKTTRKKIDAEVEKALACVDSRMTKVEKAMVLHDYIIRNTTYAEKSKKQYRLTEEGVFLKNKANCQGYSLAYGILMEKVGIPVRYVSSKSMSHMWNMIKIKGQWYHVDVTWDDPVDSNEMLDQYGLVKHNNFLCSGARMKKTGHYGFDTSTATSKKYDTKYWKNINSSFVYRDGKWLYMNGNGILEREKLVGGSKKLIYNVAGNTFVQFSQDKYYFIAYNNLYLYDYMKNSAEQVWKTSDNYDQGYYLTQIKYSNSIVYYRVLYNNTHKSGKISVNASGTVS